MATQQDLAQHIKERMEDTQTPQKIVQILSKYDGKPLTKTHVAKISEDIPVKLDKSYTMTHLVWGESKQSSGRRMLLSHQTTNVIINTQEIIQNNPSLFEAAEARNKEREEVLQHPQVLADLAEKINAYAKAKQELDEYLCHDSPVRADWISIETEFID